VIADQFRRSHLIGFVRALVATNVKAAAMLRGAFTLQVLFMILNNATFFIFWWALMRRVPHLGGWTLADVQVLFGIVATGFGLAVTFAGGVWDLGRIIDDGELDTLLTQPKPVLLHALGLRLKASGFGDVISGAAFLAFSGRVTWSAVPFVTTAILASAVVLVACGIVFFSFTFWLGRVDTLARQLWELLLTFSLYPEPLFGGVVRLALFTILPAAFVGHLPARIARTQSVADALILLAAAAGYLAFAVAVFGRGLRRYSSGSRFGTFG
jgi:ABC-2 type transport system permease protein